MDIIQKFGNAVSSMSLEDPGKARRLLLTGYRLQEKRLLFFSDKKLPKSGQYVARIVMKNIIQALSKPENSAMVSIFVPGELLTAAGLMGTMLKQKKKWWRYVSHSASEKDKLL